MHRPRGRVLDIADDSFVRTSTEGIFTAEGYAVVSAQDGATGSALARRERPDAILLDVVMPGLSGWETLERLKLDAATSEIPVVVFSGKSLRRDGDSSSGDMLAPRRLLAMVEQRLTQSAPPVRVAER